MTLKQLRVFVLAARTGSFTAAADRLGMAQASVSELIRNLETEHGMPLFTRGSRRLTLTGAGEELMPYAEQSTNAAEAGAEALRSFRSLESGVVTFGLLRNAPYYLLSDLARDFHRRYPGVRLRLVGLNSAEVADAVRAGEMEAGLAVLPIDDEGLGITPLLRDEVRYVSAEPAHLREPTEVEVLSQRRLVLYDAHFGWRDPTRRQISERAQLAGVKIEPWIEVEHVEAALTLVADGVGDTIVSSAVARSHWFPDVLGSVGFADPLYDTIALVKRRGSLLSPAAGELARLARETLRTRVDAP